MENIHSSVKGQISEQGSITMKSYNMFKNHPDFSNNISLHIYSTTADPSQRWTGSKTAAH